MYKLYCRLYQSAFRAASVFLPWRQPERINDYAGLTAVFERQRVKTVLIVTDKILTNMKLHMELIEKLTAAKIDYFLYDKTIPNPTIQNIEEALSGYKAKKCGAIIALGGGSPMDCAKGVGARVARPRASVQKMRGQFKVLFKMPLFIAIPTTAGSGSETTLTAVVVDNKTNVKYAINDPVLIPHYVLHDARLTLDVPPFITAYTGMDALCHAVEAYIGHSNTKQTHSDALQAVRLIFSNLYSCFENGQDLAARQNMQEAAFLAGAAFTRAYVGNIHAVSHALSGQYNTPHGLANAVIMPYVLDLYGNVVYTALSELAAVVGIRGKNKCDCAKSFISAIREMNAKMGIPNKISDLKISDISMLAARATKEANPLSPVPVIFKRWDKKKVLYCILDKHD
jgi:alcohol dehydrogenase class IV